MKCAVMLAAVLSAVASPAMADEPDQLFNNNCAICHQVGGVGVKGQFPRLAGRVGLIAGKPQGQDFLVSLALNGMSGTVTVDGQKIVGVMPDFSTFSDDDLATILTYASGLGGTKPTQFMPDRLKQERAKAQVSPTDMAATRNKLQVAGIIP
jgi:mono/diheme cytochrome c family protein